MSSPSSSSWLLIGTAVAATWAASAARAEEFSWQLSGVSSRLEAGNFRRDSWAVDGTYYVRPIDDSTGPYALASFLHPTTRVSAATSQTHMEYYNNDPTAFNLNGAYVLPGKKWYVGANYAETDQGDLGPSVTRLDEKGYGVLAGRYLGASTTVQVGLGRSQKNFESFLCLPPVGCPPFEIPYTETTTTDSVGLDVFHVRRFRSLTYSLQGSVVETKADFDFGSSQPSLVPESQGSGPTLRVYSVAGELFPTNRLGIRLGFSRPDGEGTPDAESYDVGTTWFFKPRVALQFTLSRTIRDDFGPGTIDHYDSAGIRFIGRL